MKKLIAALLTVASISPALAGSGQMVKKIGADGDCNWFVTSNGANGLDPLAYVFSRNDPAYDAWLILIHNALGSVTAPTFVVGAPGGEGQDCPAVVNGRATRFVSMIER